LDSDNQELDMVIGERAKNDNDEKVVDDEGKLSREAKDSLCAIINNTDKECNTFSYAI
jgi:hypothetical protein